MGYLFKLPKGGSLYSEDQLINMSKSIDVADMFAILPSGVNLSVVYIPQRGEITEINIDEIAIAIAAQINARSTDGQRATYHGVVEFLGRKCAHSEIELEKNGIRFFSEIYAYYSPYMMIQYTFCYNYSNMADVEILKKALRAL